MNLYRIRRTPKTAHAAQIEELKSAVVLAETEDAARRLAASEAIQEAVMDTTLYKCIQVPVGETARVVDMSFYVGMDG